MKKQISLVIIIVLSYILCFAPSIFAAEVVKPSIFRSAAICVSITACIYAFGVYLLGVYTKERNKKENIAQLKLLSRSLFDSFDNLLKEGGLLEELWISLYGDMHEKEKQFREMLNRARDVVAQNKMKETLEIFEGVADKIENKRMSADELAKCEDAGFSRISNLLGSEFAKLEIRELQQLLYGTLLRWEGLVEEDLFKKLKGNAVDIYPFELQLSKNREFLLSRNDLRECPGVLRNIREIVKFILRS